MARVTVEDCILHIPNQFELVVVAAQRAKQIASGTPLTIERDNDKDAVVSLREIAGKTVDIEQLKEDIVVSFRRKQMVENISRPATPENSEVQDMLQEEGQELLDTDAEDLSVSSDDNAGLSFSDENMDVED